MAEPYPTWLPELVPLSAYDGDWDAYVEALYEIYKNELANAWVEFDGRKVVQRREPQRLGKDKGFWHICGDDKDDDGTPELRRYERIRWPRAIIDHKSDARVRVWQSDRNITGKRRIFLWFDAEYLVVLEPRPKYVVLITAYCTDRPHTQRKLLADYEINSGK